MAKVGTAHLEIKPVLNQEALDALVEQIHEAVIMAVQEGVNDGLRSDRLRRRLRFGAMR